MEYQVIKQNEEKASQKTGVTANSKKPPLASLSISGSNHSNKPHPLFGENIPKNKDTEKFIRDVRNVNQVDAYMKKRFERSAHKFGLKTAYDFPDEHGFGIKYPRKHDMVALLTNSYSESLKTVSIDDLRDRMGKPRVPPLLKKTQGQQMRDQAIKDRFLKSKSSLSLTRPAS